MSGHEQFGEDLALYAIDALSGEERVSLEKHLATCPSCRLELEQLRGDGALLALSTTGPKPPQRARQRLLVAVAKEAATSAAVVQKRSETSTTAMAGHRSWWGWLGWAATAAVIVFAASLWKENAGYRSDLEIAHWSLLQRSNDLEQAQRIANALTNPEGKHFTLVAMKTPPQPQGKAIYVRSHGTVVFLANNMPALPAKKAYELWLIPTNGAPMPAGVFKPDAKGNAAVTNVPLPAGTEAKAFAITIENEGGATTPTMPIVMMGAGE